METVACYICGSDSQEPFIENNGFDIVRCVECKHVYLSPRPDIDEIGEFYNSFYLPHSKDKTLFNRIYRLVQRFTFKWKTGIISSFTSGKNILDFGGGKGDFVRFLNKCGYKSVLFDKNVNKRAVLKDKGVTAVWEEEEIKKNHFDLITMWHSLEHIHDLDRLFLLINSAIKREGSIIVAVPNIDAPEIVFLRKSWAALDSPRHLNHFSSNSLAKLFNDRGYKLAGKKRMLQDTVFNVLMSIKSRPLLIVFSPLIIIYALLVVMIMGPNRSSSLLFIFKKK